MGSRNTVGNIHAVSGFVSMEWEAMTVRRLIDGYAQVYDVGSPG